MSGTTREPVELIIAKGNKHLTKREIDRRMSEEVHPVNHDIQCPEYITEKPQQNEFYRYAGLLDNLGILDAIDTDELARYVDAQFTYKRLTTALKKAVSAKDYDASAKIQRQQDKAFNQAHTLAQSLGMNISGRCRLVVPKTDDNTTDF